MATPCLNVVKNKNIGTCWLRRSVLDKCRGPWTRQMHTSQYVEHAILYLVHFLHIFSVFVSAIELSLLSVLLPSSIAGLFPIKCSQFFTCWTVLYYQKPYRVLFLRRTWPFLRAFLAARRKTTSSKKKLASHRGTQSLKVERIFWLSLTWERSYPDHSTAQWRFLHIWKNTQDSTAENGLLVIIAISSIWLRVVNSKADKLTRFAYLEWFWRMIHKLDSSLWSLQTTSFPNSHFRNWEKICRVLW